MRTAFLIGLMATTGTAAMTFTQSDISSGNDQNCALAKATPTPSPAPRPGGAGKVIPKATLTVRKTGGGQQEATKRPGNTKWGNIVLKRSADCPKAE